MRDIKIFSLTEMHYEDPYSYIKIIKINLNAFISSTRGILFRDSDVTPLLVGTVDVTKGKYDSY